MSVAPLYAALLLAWVAAACGAPADSDLPVLGEWKLVTDSGLGQTVLGFSSGGSCRGREEGKKFLFCRWASRPDGRIDLRYGLLLPVNTAVGHVTGDEMTLDYGGSTSTWVRTGSQGERIQAAYFRGMELVVAGDQENGMKEWRLAADQGHHGALNGLAWVLATDKNPDLRNGKLAVVYAEKATARMRHPIYLDTLAAALARDGQFERAVKVEEEAVSLLETEAFLPPGDSEAAVKRFRSRIALYRSGQAYTEP